LVRNFNLNQHTNSLLEEDLEYLMSLVDHINKQTYVTEHLAKYHAPTKKKEAASHPKEPVKSSTLPEIKKELDIIYSNPSADLVVPRALQQERFISKRQLQRQEEVREFTKKQIHSFWQFMTVDTLANLSQEVFHEQKFYGDTSGAKQTTTADVKRFLEKISVNDDFVADEILNLIQQQINQRHWNQRKPMLTKKIVEDHFNFYINFLNIQTVKEKAQRDPFKIAEVAPTKIYVPKES
jgi:hypothetical protein